MTDSFSKQKMQIIRRITQCNHDELDAILPEWQLVIFMSTAWIGTTPNANKIPTAYTFYYDKNILALEIEIIEDRPVKRFMQKKPRVRVKQIGTTIDNFLLSLEQFPSPAQPPVVDRKGPIPNYLFPNPLTPEEAQKLAKENSYASHRLSYPDSQPLSIESLQKTVIELLERVSDLEGKLIDKAYPISNIKHKDHDTPIPELRNIHQKLNQVYEAIRYITLRSRNLGLSDICYIKELLQGVHNNDEV